MPVFVGLAVLYYAELMIIILSCQYLLQNTDAIVTIVASHGPHLLRYNQNCSIVFHGKPHSAVIVIAYLATRVCSRPDCPLYNPCSL